MCTRWAVEKRQAQGYLTDMLQLKLNSNEDYRVKMGSHFVNINFSFESMHYFLLLNYALFPPLKVCFIFSFETMPYFLL